MDYEYGNNSIFKKKDIFFFFYMLSVWKDVL